MNFKESVGAAKLAARIIRNSHTMKAGLKIWRSLENCLGGANASVVNRVSKACGQERSHRGVLKLIDPLCESKTAEDAHIKYKVLLKKA